MVSFFTLIIYKQSEIKPLGQVRSETISSTILITHRAHRTIHLLQSRSTPDLRALLVSDMSSQCSNLSVKSYAVQAHSNVMANVGIVCPCDEAVSFGPQSRDSRLCGTYPVPFVPTPCEG
jgi:hypothetical protein